jgi:hypothetical protein
MQLFQKMLPVIRHPRCVNCHGGIDPRTPAHEGMKEVLDGSDCDTCHGDTDVSPKNEDWVLPGQDHFFVGKSDDQLCALYAEFAMKQGHARFMSNHIEGDTLIGAAFVGLMGGARTPGAGTPPAPPADPPPMSRAAFAQLARDWLTQGQGACAPLGTISLEESVHSIDSLAPPGTADQRRSVQDGTRTVTITLRNGKYDAVVKSDITITQTVFHQATDKSGRPCTVTITHKQTQSGGGTGAATVVIKDTTFFMDTSPPQTDYRIDITLPPEKTQMDESFTSSGCPGILLPPDETNSLSFDHDSATFIIEGHVEDPRTDGRSGACDKMVKHGDVGTDKVEFDPSKPCFRYKNMGNSWTPGLMERGADIAFVDGTDIPFHVLAKWNLKFP